MPAFVRGASVPDGVNDGPGPVVRVQQGAVDQLLRVAVNGFGPFKSAGESAADALARERTREQAIKALIRSHVVAAATQGFLTNLGGLVALPLTLPVNVGATYLVQAHLVASIAVVNGHDLDSEEVRTAVLVCLLGSAAGEVLKKAGVRAGQRATMALIGKIPGAAIREINRRVGFALVAKFGTRRASVTLAKGVPLVGGVLGGGCDAATTRAVGEFARRFFAPHDDAPRPFVVEGDVVH
jgi:hypothetical protein